MINSSTSEARIRLFHKSLASGYGALLPSSMTTSPVSVLTSMIGSSQFSSSDKLERPFLDDPSAGSPTETLLRLLLPLNDLV